MMMMMMMKIRYTMIMMIIEERQYDEDHVRLHHDPEIVFLSFLDRETEIQLAG